MKRELKPNIDIMKQSTLFAMQQAYSQYKKYLIKDIDKWFVYKDGNLCAVDDHGEYRKQWEFWWNEFIRIRREYCRLNAEQAKEQKNV